MMVLNPRIYLAAAALALITPAAVAQSPAILPGTQVVDTAGNPVGTIYSVKGDQLVVETDKLKVSLPANSFTPSEGKLLFALTREQLNQQTEAALAEANAKLVAGANVYGQSGALAGTIDAIDAEFVTLKLTSGKLVRLPRNGIAASDKGAVLGVSAAELDRLANTGG
jgi:preprotein translocase subunit YajC